MKSFFEAIKDRRTVYAISKESPVSDERIKEIVEEAVKYSPSAFNSQSGKVVLLFGKEHDKLWDIALESLRKIVPAESFASTQEKIDSFKAGHGTVLFFDDNGIVEYLQKEYSLYKDNFPVWAQQSNGMLQLVVWAGLETEGLGASLQHYNELIEEAVKKEWDIPASYKLIGQMPFGKPTAAPGEKSFVPLEERLKVYGA
ncbi:nitroreductase family protein [Anaerocolumna xylanovorans]|uniref:Nitroreductase domain-containing protein n=1 Tax=Anaerocolumna xylanovorans DSM 12503 TaxID=1121345 RepID=A0A1M7YK45_9FIRM|nr:nitroreductase family protein [Anaerocolumna xylanovorans]SHO53005.1 hypothetical protein SAMN02745217_03906 [Anaerocolumna xylanovorans DSM 12503]